MLIRPIASSISVCHALDVNQRRTPGLQPLDNESLDLGRRSRAGLERSLEGPFQIILAEVHPASIPFATLARNAEQSPPPCPAVHAAGVADQNRGC